MAIGQILSCSVYFPSNRALIEKSPDKEYYILKLLFIQQEQNQ